jgi:hypothetical protein
MLNPPTEPPPPRAGTAAPGERGARLLAAVIAVVVGTVFARRSAAFMPGIVAAAGVGLAFWLGRQLGRAAPALLAAGALAAALLGGVRFEWNTAALLGLIGAVAVRRWRRLRRGWGHFGCSGRTEAFWNKLASPAVAAMLGQITGVVFPPGPRLRPPLHFIPMNPESFLDSPA